MARRLKTLTPERVEDLPDWCGACAFWETDDSLAPDCGGNRDAERLREWIRRVSSDWGDCGKIVYVDGEALGFVKYAPPGYFPQVKHMPAGLPSEDAILLACLHVATDARHAGLGKFMLQAALRDLVTRGEKALETYAAVDPVDRRHTPMMTIDFLLRQGFTVLRPHPRYPLLRLELRTLASWTESIEAALEALQIPLRMPERRPEPVPR